MELQPTFPYALFVIVLKLLQYMYVNCAAGKYRKTHFNPDFMSQFNEQHQADFNKLAPKGGYPDHGSGLYSQKLDYK